MRLLGEKDPEKEQVKPRCQWCNSEMRDSGYFGDSYFLLKENIVKPFWFDKKECLANWSKALVEAERAR